jgi:hypothetical protein
MGESGSFVISRVRDNGDMPYRRKPPSRPEPPQLPSAVSGVMRDEFLDKPFAGIGGVAGEFMAGSPGPQPPPLQGATRPQIPPWDGSSFEAQPQRKRGRHRPLRRARGTLVP